MSQPTLSMRRLVRALFALALALSPLTRADQGRACADGLADEAQLHFDIAAEQYRAGNFRGALEHFLLSNRLVPNRNVVFNIARTYEQLQRYADAHRYYVDALAAETDPRTRDTIAAAIARIAPNVAVLRVETTPPGATIYIDRRDLGSRGTAPRPLALPPGRYRVLVALDGYEQAEAGPVEARLGSETPVHLTLRRIVGHLRVEGEAGAAVHVDDERAAPVCTAPCALDLPPGPHVLYLTREGFQTATRAVQIVAGQTLSIRVVLSPLTGSLVVSADERDALVEVDGRSVGFTPVVVSAVPVGRRRVRVSLRGYTPVEREVMVRAGQQTQLNELRLVPEREITAASRSAESPEDAPSSVTLIAPQEIQAFAYPTIAEAIRGVRGVYLSDDGLYASAGVRGVGQPNDYGNRLLVLSDGQPLNDNIIGSSYIGYDARSDLGDIERIEVVRGPGSVLYGTGAFAGVVNLVTRRRDAQPGVHFGLSTYGSVARARAGLHLAFGRDAGVWASVSGARSDGRDVQLEVDDGMGGRATAVANQVDAFWSGTTAGRAWWGPLTAQWFLASREQFVPHGAYGTLFNDPRTRVIDTRGMFELRFEPWLSRAVQLMTRAFGNLYYFYGDYAYDAGRPNSEVYEGSWLGGEARLVITPNRGWRLSFGGEVQAHVRAAMQGTDGTGAFYLNEQRPFQIGAAYALLEGSPLGWLRVSAGARLDVYSTFGATLNPRLALIFRPSPRGVLKVMGGRAFRAPSIYELYYNDGGMTQVAGETVQPETIYTGEIEYSHRISDDWLALASVHSSYIEGIIETQGDGTMDSPLRYVNSSLPVLTAGAEVEVRREWRQGWMLAATYGYQLARYLPSANAMISNTQVPNAPEHLASLRGVVPIVPGAMSGALRLTLEAPRRINVDSDETTSAAVVADAVVSGSVSRFGVRYSIGVYNLFDWRYRLPITEGFASRTMLQQGRTLMLNVSASF